MRFVAFIILAVSLLPLKLTAEEEQKIVTVGFAQDTMSNDWRAAQVNEMKAALAPYPHIRFVYTDAEGNAMRQVLDLQKLAKQGVDILVTSPRDQKAMTPVITSLSQEKPVILLTRKTLSDSHTSFIGPDDHAIAQSAARLIAEMLNGKGRVVMLKGVVTATTAMAREEGFMEFLQQYPGVEVVASPVANYRRHEAIIAMEKIIRQGIAFDAIYAHSDSMAAGARVAMRRAGLDPANHIIVGIDYIPEAREAIRRGEQTASFTYPTAGRQGAELVLKLIRGEKLEKYIDVPSVLVTSDNVDEVATVFK
jgi:ribose transport system substrate-binding protein